MIKKFQKDYANSGNEEDMNEAISEGKNFVNYRIFPNSYSMRRQSLTSSK